jgi:hypothetical protein
VEEELKHGFEEFFRRGLKSLKLEEIEEMIAKVLGDAVNREYKAEVKKINFEPENILNTSSKDATEITILIQKKGLLSRDGKSSEQFVWRNLVYPCVWVNKLSTGI